MRLNDRLNSASWSLPCTAMRCVRSPRITRCVPSCSASTATMMVRVRLMPIQNEKASTIRNPMAKAPSHTSSSSVSAVVLSRPNRTPYTDDILVRVPSTASVNCCGACHRPTGMVLPHLISRSSGFTAAVLTFSGLDGSPSTGACRRAAGVSPRRLTGTRKRISPNPGTSDNRNVRVTGTITATSTPSPEEWAHR
jgi:hypothetical protein